MLITKCLYILSFLFLNKIDDGTIVPCYIAADEVKTPKEGIIE